MSNIKTITQCFHHLKIKCPQGTYFISLLCCISTYLVTITLIQVKCLEKIFLTINLIKNENQIKLKIKTLFYLKCYEYKI